MFYCKNCRLIFQNDQCQYCGEYHLKPVKDEDLILLTRRDYISARMLENILTQNQIPHIKKGKLGASFVAMGMPQLEEYSFYVTYSFYQKASEIVKEYFMQNLDGGMTDE